MTHLGVVSCSRHCPPNQCKETQTETNKTENYAQFKVVYLLTQIYFKAQFPQAFCHLYHSRFLTWAKER